MTKQKLIDVILVAAVIVSFLVAGVLGIKVLQAKKESKQLQQEIAADNIPVNNDTVVVESQYSTDDYIDDLNNSDPILESGEVITYIDDNAQYYGTDVSLYKSSNGKNKATYTYNNTDIGFDVELDKNGFVSNVSDAYNVLGDYPLVNFTGVFPEDVEKRKSIYKTLMRNHIYGRASVFYEGNNTTRLVVYPEGKNCTDLTIGEW